MTILWGSFKHIFIVFFFENICVFGSKGDSARSLNFLLLGDWGKGGTSGAYGSVVVPGQKVPQAKSYYQMAVAQAMGQYASSASPKPSFVLALGDNFYANGVSSSTDVLWSYLWKNVYLTNYPDLYIPWYPVFGNHDYGGSTDAQIQRFLDHSDDDIWMFESSYYLKTFAIPGGGSVVILFIDTTTLAPSENKCCNANGGISTDVQQQRIVAQLAFINESLASVSSDNRPTWLFVSGHYPVFSAGDKGDTEELLVYLLPLLESYGVDAYFTGHDHISEHLQYGDTHHFVAGAGSMTDKLGSSASLANMLWYGVGYSAFAAVNVTYTSFTVQYINAYGAQVYQYTVASTRTDPPSMNNSTESSLPSLHPTFAPSVNSTATHGSGAASHSTFTEQFSSAWSSMSRIVTDSSRDPLVVMSGGLLLASVLLLLLVVTFTRPQRKSGGTHKKKTDTTPTLSPLVHSHHDRHKQPAYRNTHSKGGGRIMSPSKSPGRYEGTTIHMDVERGEGADTSLSFIGERKPKAALSNLFAVLSASDTHKSRYNRLKNGVGSPPRSKANLPALRSAETTANSDSGSSSDSSSDDNVKNKKQNGEVVRTRIRAEEDVEDGKKEGHRRSDTAPN